MSEEIKTVLSNQQKICPTCGAKGKIVSPNVKGSIHREGRLSAGEIDPKKCDPCYDV